jgi:hypothetical protein
LIIGDAPLTLAQHRMVMERDRPRLERWRALARRDPRVIAAALEEQPVRSPSGDWVPAGDLYGRGHPWFSEMGENLHRQDPDFLTTVLDRFDDTYLGLAPDLLRSVSGPVVLVQADPPPAACSPTRTSSWRGTCCQESASGAPSG